MSNIPADLKYAKSHEWLKVAADGTALVGITDYAQSSLGDITFVQLPKVGAVLKAGETFGVVESVKAASDVYAPVGGTVLERDDHVDRLRDQVVRADQILTGALEGLEEAGSEFRRNVWEPVQRATAIIRGIQTGIEFLRTARQQRSAPAERPRSGADEELFI